MRQRIIVEAGGFTAYSWSAVMVRPSLADVPALALPAGVAVRPVEPGDLRAIWEADVEAFRDHNHQAAHVGRNHWTAAQRGACHPRGRRHRRDARPRRMHADR